MAFDVRTMTGPELDFAIDLAAAEGWNPGLHDADAFYAADPDGFLIGVLDGESIGCISAVAYDREFGFIGLYIVKPSYRGRGYGIQLWRAAMDRLWQQNIGLDGVVAQQDNYRKSGFALAYRNVRFETTGTGEPRANGDVVDARGLVDEVCAYDRVLFPAARAAFLRSWLERPGTRAFALTSGDRLRGFGAIRPCRTGFKIGPLFADSANEARTLYSALVSHAPSGSPVYLDVPEPNTAAMRLVEQHRMRKVFETARMYTGAPPSIDLDRVFGVTTFELG